jgi:hypothetical protein
LAKEFSDGMTAKNIRLLSSEIDEELRKLAAPGDEKH